MWPLSLPSCQRRFRSSKAGSSTSLANRTGYVLFFPYFASDIFIRDLLGTIHSFVRLSHRGQQCVSAEVGYAAHQPCLSYDRQRFQRRLLVRHYYVQLSISVWLIDHNQVVRLPVRHGVYGGIRACTSTLDQVSGLDVCSPLTYLTRCIVRACA
jgi:hypothetical protein